MLSVRIFCESVTHDGAISSPARRSETKCEDTLCDVFVWNFDERMRNRSQHIRDVEVAGLDERVTACVLHVLAA